MYKLCVNTLCLLILNKGEEKIDLEFVSETSNPKAALFMEELLPQKVPEENKQKQINDISENNLIKNNFNKNIVLNEKNRFIKEIYAQT